jgi:hypothetical protein
VNIPVWVRTVLLLGVTFAAGAMAGIGYDRHAHAARFAATVDGPLLMHHLESQLQLDSAQRTAVEAILARHQIAIDSSWHMIQPHVRATLDSAHREILGVLRPDQAALFRGAMATMHHEIAP